MARHHRKSPSRRMGPAQWPRPGFRLAIALVFTVFTSGTPLSPSTTLGLRVSRAMNFRMGCGSRRGGQCSSVLWRPQSTTRRGRGLGLRVWSEVPEGDEPEQSGEPNKEEEGLVQPEEEEITAEAGEFEAVDEDDEDEELEIIDLGGGEDERPDEIVEDNEEEEQYLQDLKDLGLAEDEAIDEEKEKDDPEYTLDTVLEGFGMLENEDDEQIRRLMAPDPDIDPANGVPAGCMRQVRVLEAPLEWHLELIKDGKGGHGGLYICRIEDDSSVQDDPNIEVGDEIIRISKILPEESRVTMINARMRGPYEVALAMESHEHGMPVTVEVERCFRFEPMREKVHPILSYKQGPGFNLTDPIPEWTEDYVPSEEELQAAAERRVENDKVLESDDAPWKIHLRECGLDFSKLDISAVDTDDEDRPEELPKDALDEYDPNTDYTEVFSRTNKPGDADVDEEELPPELI